jgi:hypothetical protein
MFIILFGLMWALNTASKESGRLWQMPSLIATAHACSLFDRIQERRANRVDFSSGEIKDGESTSVTDGEPVIEEVRTSSNRRQARKPLRNLLKSLFKR